MTPSELKYQVEHTKTDSYFFTRDSMRFFGDKMSNYGVVSCGDLWELYRKKPVKNGLSGSAYFDKKSYSRVINKERIQNAKRKEAYLTSKWHVESTGDINDYGKDLLMIVETDTGRMIVMQPASEPDYAQIKKDFKNIVKLHNKELKNI